MTAANRTLALPGLEIEPPAPVAPPASGIQRSARLSPCGLYRYELARAWGDAANRVLWVMVNPSVADGEQDDATILTIIAFSQAWGFGALDVCNLFALRATDPKELKRALRDGRDPIGPDNDRTIEAHARRARRVVVAWGRHGRLNDRDAHVSRTLLAGGAPVCLGTNADGTPWHPLYRSRSTPLVPFTLRGVR